MRMPKNPGHYLYTLFHHGKRPSYVPDALQTDTHVFVRHDAAKPPLQRPYDEPFLVIKRNDIFFIINKNCCSDTVSIDRLKPAFIEKIRQILSSVPVPPHGSMTTRSGRAGDCCRE